MPLNQGWSLSGQAVDAVGDAHLAPGMHYRVLTNPLLGLPVVPLIIGKQRLGTVAKGFTRRDITWVDSHGTVLTAPFTVAPDNPVTGHLPAGEVCCWAALEGQALRGTVGPLPLPGPVLVNPAVAAAERPPAGPVAGPVAVPAVEAEPAPPSPARPSPAQPSPARVRPVQVLATARPDLELADVRDLPSRIVSAPFWVEGVVATVYGDAPVAVRSSAPYHVYASHLERIVVHGSGTVTGLSWLPASAVTKAEPFRLAPLPTTSGPRYSGPPDGRDQGFDRVKRGAPQRFGMHESPQATSTTACGTVGAAEEVDRIEKATIEAADTLDELIQDTSAPQRLITRTENVVDENGNPLDGTTERFILMDLLMGAVDPGVARWLGFLDVDEELADPGVVVAYVVNALFAPDWKAIRKQRLDLTVAPDAYLVDAEAAATALADLAKTDPEVERYIGAVKEMGSGPFVAQRIVLAATVNVPLDRPRAPGLVTPLTGDWLPALAPIAVRELTVTMESLRPGAGLGSAIGQPTGAAAAARNPLDTIGRRVLLTPRPAANAVTATSGLLADRGVDEFDGTWQVAQMDWFGRWSPWATQTFGPQTRPKPPRPVFTLTTTSPAIPTPTPTGPLAGVVRVEVSVPPVEGLPAGGRLLQHLALTVSYNGGAPSTAVYPIATPASPPESLVVLLTGPDLLPTESGTATFTGVWVDSANVDSDASEPKTATLHDPRPPASVVMPPTLTYTARPDVTGRARASLQWTPGAGQASYRIFFADETTLRAKLKDVVGGVNAVGDAGQAPNSGQAQALLDALDAAADAPARGAVWDANRALLPRRWWLQLTHDPVPRPSSGSVTFTHDVSGSLAVLVLYRVVAVSASSVESDFRTSPLLPRGVPNLLVPPMPSLTVLPVETSSGHLQAQLRVAVPNGPTPAVRYRLRRATAASEPMLMQVVAEADLGTPRSDSPATENWYDVIDTGSSPSGNRSSLSSWVRYLWRVEVQGTPAPGGGPPSEWSTPSAPTTTVVMPPDPPVAVTGMVLTRSGNEVHIGFRHPDPLAGGASTGYTIDVYRQLPGATLRHLVSIPGQLPAPVGRGDDVNAAFDIVDDDVAAVAGTVYKVVVTDPIGRSSPATAPQEAP